ncbi:MAG: hypothetical protein CSA22_05310 [Deltaproteobacteria bacterium]|nr:MAG: hypothetical protein CSA22_05310 [Deltaproteobacteria bacterium]
MQGTAHPLFEYRIAGHPDVLLPGNPLLKKQLPADRHAGAASTAPVTLAAYFSAIHAFLAPRISLLQPDKASPVRIVMVKHGAFYHPAYIEVKKNGIWQRSHGVNVAVSPQGCEIMAREFSLLSAFQDRCSHTPHVFDMDTVKTPDGTDIALFLVEWLADHHEFHLTDAGPENDTFVVWTPEGDRFLSAPDIRMAVYHQTAEILTDLYDPRTTAHVFPWHHAAGDFVLAHTGDQVDVRLISVRQYAPMITPPPGDDLLLQLEAMWLFLIQMSIRMRLDRIDGIGDVAWADTAAVTGTVRGWEAALNRYPIHPEAGVPPGDLIRPYIHTRSDDDWAEAARRFVQTTPEAAPEHPVIKKHLSAHIFCLRETLA